MSLKPRPTHQGLILSEHVTREADRPRPYVDNPKDAATIAAHLRFFIDTWLPKMLHVPITRGGVELGQEIKGFDHLPLVVRSDVLKFPEVERTAEKMLVRFAHIRLTKPDKEKSNGKR